MAKEKKERAAHYEPKIVLKEGTKFVDLINASLHIKKDKPVKKEKKG